MIESVVEAVVEAVIESVVDRTNAVGASNAVDAPIIAPVERLTIERLTIE